MPSKPEDYKSELTREALCIAYCDGLTDEWLAFYKNNGCRAKWVWDELQKLRYPEGWGKHAA